jgi:dCTP deaminase
MILHSHQILKRIEGSGGSVNPLIIKPLLDKSSLEKGGQASLDLRLGQWFLVLRPPMAPILDVAEKEAMNLGESKLSKLHFVPFGEKFIVHPNTFVLGVTLEWLKLPNDLCGEVIGRSSWGRRGLIIATATGVHPGFTGCLTLEITNVGEIPISIKPGMAICQIFLSDVHQTEGTTHTSNFNARRKPILGKIIIDEIAKKLAKKEE